GTVPRRPWRKTGGVSAQVSWGQMSAVKPVQGFDHPLEAVMRRDQCPASFAHGSRRRRVAEGFTYRSRERGRVFRRHDPARFAVADDAGNPADVAAHDRGAGDRKSTRLNSSHDQISYAV